MYYKSLYHKHTLILYLLFYGKLKNRNFYTLDIELLEQYMQKRKSSFNKLKFGILIITLSKLGLVTIDDEDLYDVDVLIYSSCF